ncbi:MAG: hemolysin family protein [Planctomycetota bacterium]
MDTDIADLPLRLAILAVAFCLSAFFSGSETALFSFQPHELSGMEGASGAAGAVARLRRRPKRLLITVLFGNMVVNVVFFSVSYLLIVKLEPLVHGTGAFLLGVASLLAIIVGGEVMPKNVAVTFHRPIGRAVALPLLLMQRVLLPLIIPLEKVADVVVSLRGRRAPAVHAEELEMLAELSAREGVMDVRASQMIAEVIGLSEVRVNELMVPRVEMVSFNLREPEAELLPLFQREKLSVIPVYDGEMDEMRGVVHIKDVLFKARERPLRELVRPVPFLPETATVEEALRRCRRDKSKNAFVVDEYGAVLGLVTVEDLLEEIVGEIADEYDPESTPPVQPLPDGGYRLAGSLSLRTWQELSRTELPALGVDTVGGLVMALLDKVPAVGDTVRHGGLEYAVVGVRGRRATTLIVRPTAGQVAKQEAQDA